MKQTTQKPKHENPVVLVALGIFIFLVFASVALCLNVMNKPVEFNADCTMNGINYGADFTNMGWHPMNRTMTLNNSAIHCSIYGKGSQLMLVSMMR